MKIVIWLIAILAMPALAIGQETRPRILLVFDTSGSMGAAVDPVSRRGNETGGDGSAEHPGIPGLTSRIFVAKEEVRRIVETTAEAEFALMRYPQREALGLNGDGSDGNSYSNLRSTPLNYYGQCTGSLRPQDEQAFSLLVPFQAGNEAEVISWLNHREAWPTDREIRASGETAIVHTLGAARDYLEDVIGQDQERACRAYAVVLLTDGSEQCTASAETDAALLRATDGLTQIELAQSGSSESKSVGLFVLGFGVNDRAFDQMSMVARRAGTAVDEFMLPNTERGGPYQASDSIELRSAFNRILSEAIPSEICDGLDDDCDGRIDEGVLNRCGDCGTEPPERCNGLDEDCDGLVDEGVTNRCGRCGANPVEICNRVDDDCDGQTDEGFGPNCADCNLPEPEICNGVDDDCDGYVDNIAPSADNLSRGCSTDVGDCTRGTQTCQNGVWGRCSGILPLDESCDGRDNDCNGVIDDVFRECGSDASLSLVGQCRPGRRICDAMACITEPDICESDGFVKVCTGVVEPVEELCDGLDNDCDGRRDEGVVNACGLCGPPLPEACNGIDDNCDGRVDEGAQCPIGYTCFGAQCVIPCVAGECSLGDSCVFPHPRLALCHPRPCIALGCPEGEACDVRSGRCQNPCLTVECPSDQVCELGTCIEPNCRHTGCPQGQHCIAESCVGDPCTQVECSGTSFCREGACIESCIEKSCPIGSWCRDGVCQEEPCDGRCLRGTICDESDGLCVVDPCIETNCPLGTACQGGRCLSDAPCVHISCPLGTTCHIDFCTDFTPSGLPVVQLDQPTTSAESPPDGGAPMGGESTSNLDPSMITMAPQQNANVSGGCSQAPSPADTPWHLMMLWLATLTYLLVSRHNST